MIESTQATHMAHGRDKTVNYDQKLESAQLLCINHLTTIKILRSTLLGKVVGKTCATSNKQNYSEDVKPRIFAIFLLEMFT